ncbi:MAG: hypothetical protein CMJ84_08955 [Planctomycetes bacterium]|nr:hypothetical protein [Planctomycetota bacterium]
MLFGRTTGIVASPSRGEPLFVFLEIERTDIHLAREEQIELPGGALLMASSGPFVVELRREDVLRVTNQSKAAGEIAFRDRVFGLYPGQGIDVPLLSIGGKPVESNPGTALGGAGFPLEVQGDVEAGAVDHGWRVTAGGGEHEVGALGVRLRLGRGESALVRGLEAISAPPAGASGEGTGDLGAPDGASDAPGESGREAQPGSGVESDAEPEPGAEPEAVIEIGGDAASAASPPPSDGADGKSGAEELPGGDGESPVSEPSAGTEEADENPAPGGGDGAAESDTDEERRG